MSYRVSARCSGCQSIRPFQVDAAGRGRCLACGSMTVVGSPVPQSANYRRRLW